METLEGILKVKIGSRTYFLETATIQGIATWTNTPGHNSRADAYVVYMEEGKQPAEPSYELQKVEFQWQ